MLASGVFGCGTATPSGSCVNAKDCSLGQECRLGECRAVASPAVDGGTSDAGMNLGASCQSASSCGSGFCVDGVCCDTACNKGCGTCNAADKRGTCTAKLKDSPCGSYLCGGVSVTCPESCVSSLDCDLAFGCCLPNGAEYRECNVLGQAGKCTKLKACSKTVDDFSGTTLKSSLWAPFSETAGTATVELERLALSAGTGRDANGFRSVNIDSTQRCSMSGDTISVELVDATQMKGASDGGNTIASFAVFSPETGKGFSIGLQGAKTLYATADRPDAGETVVTAASDYRSDSMRFLRISENNGFLTFSYSSTGKDDVIFDRKPSIGHVGDARVNLRLFVDRPIPSSGPKILFDNYNIIP